MEHMTWDTVEKLAREWYETPEEGNAALRSQLEQKVFMGLFSLHGLPVQLYGDQLVQWKEEEMNGIIEFFTSDWKKFDPNRASLKTFSEKRIERRKMDVQRKDQGMHTTTVEEKNLAGEKEKVKIRVRDVGLTVAYQDVDGSYLNWEDQKEDPDAQKAFDRISTKGIALDTLALILTLPDKLRGKANNPIRHNYYRMFFTDTISEILHDDLTTENYFEGHRRDLFSAMKLPFLDYFLALICRTEEEIRKSPLKLYGEMVEGRPLEETKHPLADDIYIAYLKNEEQYHAGAGAVSQQRTAYRKFLKDYLC